MTAVMQPSSSGGAACKLSGFSGFGSDDRRRKPFVVPVGREGEEKQRKKFANMMLVEINKSPHPDDSRVEFLDEACPPRQYSHIRDNGLNMTAGQLPH